MTSARRRLLIRVRNRAAAMAAVVLAGAAAIAWAVLR
jgi:hypothetical protein